MPMIFVLSNTTIWSFLSLWVSGVAKRYQAPVVQLGLFDLEMKKVIDGHNPRNYWLGGKRGIIRFWEFWDSKNSNLSRNFYAQLDQRTTRRSGVFSTRSIQTTELKQNSSTYYKKAEFQQRIKFFLGWWKRSLELKLLTWSANQANDSTLWAILNSWRNSYWCKSLLGRGWSGSDCFRYDEGIACGGRDWC